MRCARNFSSAFVHPFFTFFFSLLLAFKVSCFFFNVSVFFPISYCSLLQSFKVQILHLRFAVVPYFLHLTVQLFYKCAPTAFCFFVCAIFQISVEFILSPARPGLSVSTRTAEPSSSLISFSSSQILVNVYLCLPFPNGSNRHMNMIYVFLSSL